MRIKTKEAYEVVKNKHIDIIIIIIIINFGDKVLFVRFNLVWVKKKKHNLEF